METKLLSILLALAVFISILFTFSSRNFFPLVLFQVLLLVCVGYLAVDHFIRSRRQSSFLQKIVVLIPIPKKVPVEVLPLLLDGDDHLIAKFLLREGKIKKRNEKGLIVEYSGEQVYFPTLRMFLIWERKCFPSQIKVLSTSGFDLLTSPVI